MIAYLPLGIRCYIWILVFVLGAVMGSGLNCLAYRIAHGEKWSRGRSACAHCGHVLGAKDLVPLLSFLLLKGKCRYCGVKLSLRYFLTELLLGLCYVATVARFGISWDAASGLVLISCLFALSLVDLEIQIIPDRFLIIAAGVRMVQLAMEGRFFGGMIPALIFGGGLFLLSLVMDRILKKESMGGGDIKLVAVLGLYFSVPECLLLMMLACVFGIAGAKTMTKSDSDGAFPFGPALSLAAMVTLLIGEPVTGWYLNLL